jgi:hypothetical protein
LPLATEAKVQFQGSSRGICGGQSVRERGSSVTALVLPCHHSASAPYAYFIYVPLTLYNLSDEDDKIEVDEMDGRVACMGGVKNS